MSRDTNDVGGGGDGGNDAGRKNDTRAPARRSFLIAGSAKILPLLSSIHRGSRRSAADTSRRGGDDANDDREPHAALVREICSQLHHRLTVIAHTQTAEEVKEVSVQLLVALEKFRAEGIARNASAKSARVSVSGPDVPEEVAAVPGEGVSPRPKSTFDRAMDGRMAVLVERNDQESVAQRTRAVVGEYKMWYHLLFGAPNDDGMYDIFLNFVDPDFRTPEMRADFLSFKRSDANVPLQIFILLSCMVYVGTRFWFNQQPATYAANPTALAAILVAVAAALCLLANVFLRMAVLSYVYNIRGLKRFQLGASVFLASRFGRVFDDGIVVGGALSVGLYLLAQALSAACPPGATAFHTQGCNPAGSVGSVPPEVMVLAIIAVLVFQCVARGVSKVGLCLGWVVTLVAVNASLTVMRNDSYLWVNLEVVFGMCLSYELERMPLRQFIKSVRVVEASEANGQLQLQVANYEVREAGHALEAKRSMVRHIGHEIRTPLNVIAVGADVLCQELKALGVKVPPVITELVEGIQDASETAMETVNEFLMFETMAAGMATIEPTPTMVVPFLNKGMRSHLITAKAKEIDFTITNSPLDMNLAANMDPMTVVFRNLFSNAIKFSKRGGKVSVSVTRKASRAGADLVLVSVKDAGAGLSAQDLTRLFQEGVQFNANKHQGGGGSGLGLYITKGIVEMHVGAKIWAESEGEGHGCTFFVEIPTIKMNVVVADVDGSQDADVEAELEKVPSAQAPAPAAGPVARGAVTDLLLLPRESRRGDLVGSAHPPSRLQSAAPSQEIVAGPSGDPEVEVFRPCVLVVDDSPLNRRVLVRLLEQAGFDTVQAGDGLAALAVISRVDVLRRGVLSGHGSKEVWSRHGSMDEAAAPAPSPCTLNPPDCILMDSNMPMMNGPDACREIRKLGYKFPIFGVTGDAEVETFIRAGADGVMLKPVKADALLLRVKAAILDAVEQAKAAARDGSDAPSLGVMDLESYERNLKEWLAAHSPKEAQVLKGTSVTTLRDISFHSSSVANPATAVIRQVSALTAVLKATALADEVRAEEKV